MKKLLAILAAVGLGLVTLAAPASASPKAPNVHGWLLTLSNMPQKVGWAQQPPSSSSSPVFCSADNLTTKQSGSWGEVNFARGISLGMSEVVASWATQAVAKKDWQAATGLLANCHRFGENYSGQTFQLKVKPMSFAGPRGDSTAYQATGAFDGFPVVLDFVVVLKGDAVMLMVYGGLGTPITGDVQAMVKLAMGKIQG
jgi:hypothetical protein